MKQTKIAFLSSWFPSRVHATDGNFVEKHARILAPHFDLVVLHIQFDPGLANGQMDFQIEVNDGFKAYILYYGWHGRGGELVKRWLRWRAYRRLWKKVVAQWGKPDILHAHILFDAGIVAAYWSRRHQIPYVLSEHSSIFHHTHRLTWVHRQLAKWAARKARYIMPVSQQLAEVMQQLGLQSQWLPIPNSVNSHLFSHQAAPSPPPFRFLHISNFVPAAKNTKAIIRVFAKLVQADQDCQLTIAGDGDLAPLVKEADTLGLSSPQLQFLGSQTEEAVAQLMQSHHVFVLFSNYENLPVVLLEAQSCGMPVIATKVGGIPEIIDSLDKGILIAAADETALLETMQQIKANYEQFDPTAISQMAQQRYSEDLVRTALETIYKDLLA